MTAAEYKLHLETIYGPYGVNEFYDEVKQQELLKYMQDLPTKHPTELDAIRFEADMRSAEANMTNTLAYKLAECDAIHTVSGQ